MHMLAVISGGVLLLAVFALFGRLWGGDVSGIVTALKLFVPVWIVLALTNMWVGVTKAGYTVAQELPILAIVALAPVAIALGTGYALAGVQAAAPSQSSAGHSAMTNAMPQPVKAAVDAINAGDEAAFVAAFSPSGSINDWGRVLTGHEGVRSWARSDAIGAGAQMTIQSAETAGNVTHIVFGWKSRVFNGNSQAYVTVVDGLITEFRIPSH